MKLSAPILTLIILSTAVFAQSNVAQILTSMSNAHINEIANGSISSTISSYVSSPYLFANMNYTNFSNTYYGQTGIISILTNITSYGTPYTVYMQNSSVVEINSTLYSVNRNVWLVSHNQTYTLKVPYTATYININGTWLIYAEWFGTNSNAGTILQGTQIPANLTTTIPVTVAPSTTTTPANTTTVLYTVPGQNGAPNSTATQIGQNQQPNLLIVVAIIVIAAVIILYILMMRKKA